MGQLPENRYIPKITVEKIQHIFEYGKLKNITGTNNEKIRDLKGLLRSVNQSIITELDTLVFLLKPFRHLSNGLMTLISVEKSGE